jgi:NADH-quinone oxidoreductase subunit H
MIALIFALTSISVIPIGNSIALFGIRTPLEITDVNIGLLIVLGVTSLGVYGVALAGWSSNSKYSLLGGLRASAQMVSYEISLGLSLVGVLILAGSFSLRDIVDAQSGTFWGFIPRWNIFQGQFIAFFIYLMAAYAETNRIPFDLPEAETELVAGYHTEYSAMKFAMFFMAEYANMITVACLATLLFLGGWHGPHRFGPPIVQAILPVFWFVAKIFAFLFLYIWVRGTLPRFRYDQLMAFGWKFLLPLAIANLVITALIVALRA